MKAILTLEESAKLIDLGIDPKLSSKETFIFNKIFTLTDILSILPKEIEYHHLDIEASNAGYHVSYMLWDSCDEAYHYMGATERPELIDALNSLLIWAIENKYVTPKQEKK